eukprot:CAMPEP_0185739652 /NCGR_PEP_ID=MMETSP1171-20130828/35889_1 /TAXON_ID=374046 /ORGANISM="Helicotheca tamensis, Strain CCMP826" /LENGTH=698 /DNA_ID=CAMNT_0028411275 /DNA_START=1 /DNA_END=2093 /DNA_ORIENTATION=-
MTYDHTTSRMVVDFFLPGEKNSDSSSTLRDFAIRALTDCVSKGARDYMFIFGGEGAGYAGAGGDDHTQRRRLIQSNEDIVTGLRAALDYVDGAPDQFDVIGFDASTMMSFLSLKLYEPITRFFLASEEAQPGHRWAYSRINSAQSALGIAREIQSAYINDLHGNLDHQTPKTLAIVDTTEFRRFSINFEALAEEFTRIIRDGNDINFHVQLERSRQASISTSTYLDRLGSMSPSGVDIGSFLSSLKTICKPLRTSDLNDFLSRATSSYDSMFVSRGTGDGTIEATGMHVLLPTKRTYVVDKPLFNTQLFKRGSVAREASGKWAAFVAAFLTSTNDFNPDTDESVCNSNAISDIEPNVEGELLLRPVVTEDTNEISVITDLSTSTDWVYVEYGIEASAILSTSQNRRILEENISSKKKFKHPCFSWKEQQSHRSMQRGDYLHLFLGANLKGIYRGSKYGATWSKQMYGIESSDKKEFFYTFYKGGTSLSMPVVYFPEDSGVTEYNLRRGTQLEGAIERGGMLGELTFGFNPSTLDIDSEVTLLANDFGISEEPGPTYEIPRSAGGSIMSLSRVQGKIDDVPFDLVIVGGWDLIQFQWNEETTLLPFSQDAGEYLASVDLSHVVLEVGAFDYDVYSQEIGTYWMDSESYFIDVVDNRRSRYDIREYADTRGFDGDITGYNQINGASCLMCNGGLMIGSIL